MSVVVVYSGGMDSTTLLADIIASQGHRNTRAVSFDYGQRHGHAELRAATKVTHHYGVPHDVVDLSSLAKHLPGSALTDPSVEVPEGHYAHETMAATVVPNRNLIMLSVAAGVAAAHGFSNVATAVHAGDHPVYVDCRPEFIAAADLAIRAGTGNKVGLLAPYVGISKTDIVFRAVQVNAPLGMSWSCYNGGDIHCGSCGTCYERREAFRDAGVPDPTEYAATPEFADPR